MRRGLRHASGFTLIEVMIALFVIALGMGALLTTLSSASQNAIRLRDRSFSYWIALNRIADLRLSTSRTGVGVTYGSTEYAGSTWRWRQEVTDPEMAGILRVDVAVAPTSPDGAAESGAATRDEDEDEDFAPISTAYGFLGTAVARASGIDPDWSLEALRTAVQSGGPPGGQPGGETGGGVPRGGPPAENGEPQP